MKISIMLTSYNLVDYIDTSIASVVNQEMPCEWELLIGDDGSNDGTVDKIKAWIEKYPENIKLFQIPRDSSTVKVGSRAAKNRAYLLENASGDYLHYLDGDDCWLGTTKLKEQFMQLEKLENADCSCCAHNTEAYVIPEERRYLLTDGRIKTQKFGFHRYWRQYYFHTDTILFRKECKEKLLDSLYRDYLNDNFITFLVIQYGKILYLKDVWAQYNMTGTGLWTGHSKMYGLFRNMQCVDLQFKERPDARKIIILRHYQNFKNLLKDYSRKDYKDIEPLLYGLDKDVFHTTILLSRIGELDEAENTQLKKLKQEVRRIGSLVFLQKICNKLKSIIKH